MHALVGFSCGKHKRTRVIARLRQARLQRVKIERRNIAVRHHREAAVPQRGADELPAFLEQAAANHDIVSFPHAHGDDAVFHALVPSGCRFLLAPVFQERLQLRGVFFDQRVVVFVQVRN